MSWLDQLLSSRSHKREMISPEQALPGRTEGIPVADEHLLLHHPLRGAIDPESTSSGHTRSSDTGIGDFGTGLSAVILAGGCFWGIEEIYWQLPGVYTTAVGYAGGYTPNPTYNEVCSARTGHTESVLVVFDPEVIDLEGVLKVFWESHDPTQEMRQGNDVGTQYRSAIYTLTEADARLAAQSAQKFGAVVSAAGLGPIATEISPLGAAGSGTFYYAEDYHQQYLAKNPHGYRCHAATGLRYPAA